MARRDRIGGDDMRDHLAVAFAVKRNLADREPGAELEQRRLGAYCGRFRALCLPYFLRSTTRLSRVRNPCCFKSGRNPGS